MQTFSCSKLNYISSNIHAKFSFRREQISYKISISAALKEEIELKQLTPIPPTIMQETTNFYFNIKQCHHSNIQGNN